MADKQSVEKQALLRAYGAEVVLCPTNVAPESPESYYSVAARLARDIPGAFKPDQYWNMENPGRPRAHDRPGAVGADRGPDHPLRGERRDGRHDLRRRPRPEGAQPGDPGHRRRSRGLVLSGDTARPYLTEGVGEDFFPGTYDAAVIDRWVRVSDRDAFAMARRITREEGILVGRLVRDGDGRGARGRPRADGDRRWSARRSWSCCSPTAAAATSPRSTTTSGCASNGLLPTTGASTRIEALLADRHHDAGSADRDRRADDGARRRRDRDAAGVRHQPAARVGGARGRRGRRAGRLDQREGPARSGLSATRAVVERTVGEVMDPPLPLVEASATLDEAFALLSGGASALVVVRGESSGRRRRRSSTCSSTWRTTAHRRR